MKHFTFIFSCLTIFSFSAAAQKFLHKSKADAGIPGVEKQYRDIFGEAEYKHRMNRENNRFGRLFNKEKVLTGADLTTWPETTVVYMQMLITPDGKTDYCIYEVRDFNFNTGMGKLVGLDSIGDRQKENFRKVIQRVLEQFTWKFDFTEPVQFTVSMMPNLPMERKVRTDRISTLEDAKATTMPDTVTRINLSGLNLMTFPEVLYRFPNLREIDLSKNYLQDLPGDLKRFKKLKLLDVSTNDLTDASFHFKRNKSVKLVNALENNLTRIPRNMSKNRKLEDLLLGNNEMTAFGKTTFRRFKNLKNLNLYDCNLTELPAGLSKMKKLEVLDVYHNKLRFLPKEIGEMKHLSTLAVSNNQLWKLPDEIALMTALKKLYAHHNKLDRLPTLPAGLTLLDIGYNDFITFPETISDLSDMEEIDISFNKITDLPIGLLTLTKLKQAFLSSNEFLKDDKKEKEVESLVNELDKRSVLVRK